MKRRTEEICISIGLIIAMVAFLWALTNLARLCLCGEKYEKATTVERVEM